MEYNDRIVETAKSFFRLSREDQLTALSEILKGYDTAFKKVNPDVPWSSDYPFWGIGTEIKLKTQG